MMRTIYKVGIAVLVVAVGTTLIWAGRMTPEVPLRNVPKNVLDAALEAVPGIRLHDEVEVERERGTVVYDLEGLLDGRKYEIEVTQDGRVLEVEPRFERDIPLKQVPAVVADAARKAVPGSRVAEAAIVVHEGAKAYEIDVVRDGTEFEVIVTPSGAVVRVQEEGRGPDDDGADDNGEDGDEDHDDDLDDEDAASA